MFYIHMHLKTTNALAESILYTDMEQSHTHPHKCVTGTHFGGRKAHYRSLLRLPSEAELFKSTVSLEESLRSLGFSMDGPEIRFGFSWLSGQKHLRR